MTITDPKVIPYRLLTDPPSKVRYAREIESHLLPDSSEFVLVMSPAENKIWLGYVAPYDTSQIVVTLEKYGQRFRLSLDECRIARLITKSSLSKAAASNKAAPKRKRQTREKPASQYSY